MFSPSYVHYLPLAYMRFLCFDHSRVNFTPSMFSGKVLEWQKNTPQFGAYITPKINRFNNKLQGGRT